MSRFRKRVAGAGLVAVLIAGGVAFAQPDRLLQPPDPTGPAPPPLSPLQMPSDPGTDWLLGANLPGGVRLQLEGTLEAAGPDQMRIERGPQEPAAIVYLRPQTLFFLGGEAVSRTEIPIGANVQARYGLDGNRRVADRIDATPGVPPAGE